VKLQSRHIFFKSILIAVFFSIFFWVAESVAHMFYFSETFEYFLSHEPLDFMDAFIYHVPKYSLFIRLVFISTTMFMGGIIGFLLERDHKHTAELLARERDYHDAVNAVNEGIFTYYTDTNKIVASRLCYSLLGYRENELDITPEGFYKLLNIERREELKKSFEKHIADGKSFSFNLKVKTRSGKWKWILLKGNVREANKDGSAKRIMGIVADVSQKMAIRKQLEHYTSCLEEAERVAHVGHWRIDYKTKKSSWSKEVYKIMQIAVSEKPSEGLFKFTDVIHPEDSGRIRKSFFSSIRNKSYFAYDFRIILKDKSIKYISQRGHHVFDKDGKLDYSFGTIQDITSSSLATQALANSEKRYRALFENVHQGIVIIDCKTQEIKLANNFFCDMFGYTRSEILSRLLKDLRAENATEGDSLWMLNEKTFAGDIDCRRKDGSVFEVEVYSSEVVLEERKCIIAMFKDLTESYRAEYDRYMLKAAIDNSDVEILITNLDGSIDYCSPALCKRLGYKQDELKNMKVSDIEYGGSDNHGGIDFKSTKTQKGECIQIAKDGTKYEVDYVADYIKIGSRELICCSIQDVTENKRREAILKSARRKAEESDRLKSVFLANISHEIRTPMNGILGFADLLQREDLPPEKSQQYAKIIANCGNNLMQLLNDILDISRIEAGEIELKKEDFCINKVVEDLFNFYEPQIREEGKSLSLQMHKSLRDDEAVIYSDRRYLNQILTNLLSNAIKFTHKGGIMIGYNAKRNGIEFFVKDSGEGIAPEMLDKIFEPFRQGEEILSRKYHGSGLGLAIAKSYAELLGGYMWVESEPGTGTTFYFTLPYSRNSSLKLKTSKAPDKSDYNWKGKKILVVEDSRISYMLLENLLEETGAEVFRAESAGESIDMVKTIENLDLVLMDVRLPDFTGWEASKIIKKDRPELPIIVQTANASADDKIKTFQAGCDAYLTKPIIKKIFYETIAKTLSQQNN
jgi:hypothetical protein